MITEVSNLNLHKPAYGVPGFGAASFNEEMWVFTSLTVSPSLAKNGHCFSRGSSEQNNTDVNASTIQIFLFEFAEIKFIHVMVW